MIALQATAHDDTASVTWVALTVNAIGVTEEHIFATHEECMRFALNSSPFGPPIFQRVDHTGRR